MYELVLRRPGDSDVNLETRNELGSERANANSTRKSRQLSRQLELHPMFTFSAAVPRGSRVRFVLCLACFKGSWDRLFSRGHRQDVGHRWRHLTIVDTGKATRDPHAKSAYPYAVPLAQSDHINPDVITSTLDHGDSLTPIIRRLTDRHRSVPHYNRAQVSASGTPATDLSTTVSPLRSSNPSALGSSAGKQ